MSDLIRAILGVVAVIIGIILVPQATSIQDLLGILIGGVAIIIGLGVALFYGARYRSDQSDRRSAKPK